MNDDRLDDALRASFQTKYLLDERLKAQTKRAIYEKREQRDKFMICLIQIALSILTFLIAAILIVNQGIVILFIIIGYVLIGSFISVIVALTTKNNTKITEEGQFL